jgi:hypothetical protein
MADYKADPNDPNKQIPNTTYRGGPSVIYTSGSIQFYDTDALRDEGGDKRLSFTDAGSLVLHDESGNAGITLGTGLDTTFAGGISGSSNLSITGHADFTGDITGSSNLNIVGILSSSNATSTPVLFTLPTVDPAVAGALFTTGSTTATLGGITGSGCQLVMISQG